MNAILNHGSNGTATTGSVLTNSDVIAIYGGDARTSRLGWPKGYNIRFFQATKFGGNGETERLVSMLRGRRIGTLILLTKFMSHSDSDTLRRVGRTYANRLIMWTKGPGELSRELSSMVPMAVKPISIPEVIMVKDAKTVESKKPESESAKKANERKRAVSPSIRAEIIALAGKKSQAEIGKLYGLAQSSVSYIVRGLKHGTTDGTGRGNKSAPQVTKGRPKIAPPLVRNTVAIVPDAPSDKPPVIVALEKMTGDLAALGSLLIESIASIEARISRIENALAAAAGK